MHEREDKFPGEGETDPGPDPGAGTLRRSHPALRHQWHWYVAPFISPHCTVTLYNVNYINMSTPKKSQKNTSEPPV